MSALVGAGITLGPTAAYVVLAWTDSDVPGALSIAYLFGAVNLPAASLCASLGCQWNLNPGPGLHGRLIAVAAIGILTNAALCAAFGTLLGSLAQSVKKRSNRELSAGGDGGIPGS